MPETIVFAAWLGGMLVPTWYVLSHRWRWALWALLGILFVTWVNAAGWKENLPAVATQVFVEFIGYGILGWAATVVILRFTRWNNPLVSRSLSVFWVFAMISGFISTRPVIMQSSSMQIVNHRLAQIYGSIIRTAWRQVLLLTHQATFGSIWLHLVELIMIALIFSLPALLPRISLPQGLARTSLALTLPLVWQGFYKLDPSPVSWPLYLLVWVPFGIVSTQFILQRMTARYPWLRPAILIVILGLAWSPAVSAGHHAANPAFPPAVSGVLWANRQAAHFRSPIPSAPAPWLVDVSKSQSHMASAIAINPHASLVPGAVKRPPPSWHPMRLTTALAQRTLNHMVASSLASTSLWALAAAILVLFLALGALPATGLAVGLGASASILSLAIIRGLEILWPISPYALNIANLLAVGLSIDYAIFQIHAFRQAWRSGESLSRPIRIQQARHMAVSHAQEALPWSAGALIVALIAFPLALPGGLGWSFALASVTATAMAVLCSQFLVIPLLSAYPEFWFRIKLPIALSDILDRTYRHIGRWSVVCGLVSCSC